MFGATSPQALEFLSQFSVNTRGVLTKSLTDREEFNYIKPALTMLDAPDEGMLAVQPRGELPMRKARLHTHLDQFALDGFTLAGVNRLLHVRIVRTNTSCSQNASKVGSSTMDRINGRTNASVEEKWDDR